MLLKSEIRKVLKKELGAFLKPYGYKPQSTETGFLRKTKEGNNTIGIAIVDYRPKFLLGIPFAIRLDAVEKICNYLCNTMPQYQSDTTTIIIPCRFFDGFDEHKITNSQGLQEFINYFKTLYADKIDTFLVANSTLQGLVKTLFIDYIEFGPLFQHYHFITRIVVAYLGKIEFYDLIAEEYYKIYCENYPDSKEEQAEIRHAIEYLKTVDPDRI
jgi:hypothetical protein